MDQQNESHAHDEIAPVARAIWEQQGQPEGKAEEHWQQAEQLLVEGRHRRQEAEAFPVAPVVPRPL